MVYFHRERKLGTVTDKYVGAGVEALASVIDNEVGHIFHIAAAIGGEQGRPALVVAVEAGDDAIGEHPRIANLTQGVLQILRIDDGRVSGRAELEDTAQKIIAGVAIRRGLASLEDRPLLRFIPADLAADAPELLEYPGIDSVNFLAANSVDARPAERVAALWPSPAAMTEAPVAARSATRPFAVSR
jgi:hypothetical protein